MIGLIIGLFAGVLIAWAFTKMHYEKRLNKAFHLYCKKQKMTVQEIEKEFEQFNKKTNVTYELKEY